MFNSPFTEDGNTDLTPDSDIVFVSDFFVEDLQGGAELTSEALIESSPFSVYKLQKWKNLFHL